MDWVNFREIRERISIERVVREYYRIDNLKLSGKTATCPCPVHNGDNPRGFHIDFEKNLWHCFTKCKAGGNQLDLVAAKDQVSVREAAIRLKRFFLGGDDGAASAASPVIPSPRTQRDPNMATVEVQLAGRTTKEAVNPPLALALPLLPDHPHILQDRKLQQSTAEHFGVGYCAKGILAGCIGFPIHDETGQLVAYAGRRLKFSEAAELGKYRFPKGFHKDRVLYNLHRALPAAGDEPLVLVEGFFSVLKLHELGVTSCAAVMGSDLSDHQATLAARAKRVVVMFDGNEAGRIGAVAAARKLDPLTRVSVLDLPETWEPENCSQALLQSLIASVIDHDLHFVSFERTLPTGNTRPVH